MTSSEWRGLLLRRCRWTQRTLADLEWQPGMHPYLNINTTSGGSRISQTGAPTPQEKCLPIILQNFCRKLHGNKKI